MERRLLQYYDQELRHLRQMGREFAEEFPKIAKRLDPDSFKSDDLCLDPYVERLLEGFAFLAARVRLKIDAEFPRFTQHLLEFVYPHYLAPTPSMAVVRMQPEDCPPEGFTIPRGTVLKSGLGPGEQTRCEFRTAHELRLWPVEIAEASYLANPSAIPQAVHDALAARQKAGARLPQAKAAIRLRLRGTGGQALNQLGLDSLPVFLSGGGGVLGAQHLYEQMLANAVAVAVLGKAPSALEQGWCELVLQKPRRLGFGDEEALLPYGPRSFQGYRLLQEYFAFPKRFQFVELAGLGGPLRRATDDEVELFVLLKEVQAKLVNGVDKDQFALFCTPAVNLFPKRADPVHLSQMLPEYQIIPDRTRTADFEVYAVEAVTGHGVGADGEQPFLPFYSADSGYRQRGGHAYYTLSRRKTVLSSKQRQQGQRTPYVGTETYIALVDADEAPYRASLKRLELKLLCTNRDLPHSRRGKPEAFNLEIDAPVKKTIHCVAGPTDPSPSTAVAETAWRLVSHLSLNYLSLLDSADGAQALRELLSLYGDPDDDALRKQIEGILSVRSKNVVRRIDAAGPIVFGRGVEITVNFDEAAFEGGSAFLLGAVLECFFARYASLNTFTETVITTDKREIMRWPIRTGQRHAL